MTAPPLETEAPDPGPIIAWMEGLTPATLPDLARLAIPELRFVDPFHDSRGVDRVQAIYAGMFRRLPQISFQVTERAWSGQAWLLVWRLEGRDRRGRLWPIAGMSRLAFAPDGRLAEHIDHWDAASQIYARIPGIGALIRALKRRAATG